MGNEAVGKADPSCGFFTTEEKIGVCLRASSTIPMARQAMYALRGSM